ncbi:hypothetical protein [Sulfolobus spindle-shaped virus]|nr:hypothetical protein [Sulfolobus spindle-shaped virus]AZG03239.1 hypothetical protein [Sulfolobus spindle-shaped virus]AZG03298.1 hypothetical protein [Sulfolobus spindle-shaped virus]AZG03361.1 hypothetical protein [Sulfolobus spindle-shaped virus]AZG03445.1 hypothetical protein [Sulfolobus spindle-shaped virus]
MCRLLNWATQTTHFHYTLSELPENFYQTTLHFLNYFVSLSYYFRLYFSLIFLGQSS